MITIQNHNALATSKPNSYILHIMQCHLNNTSSSTRLYIHCTPSSYHSESQISYQHTPLQNNIHVSKIHCGGAFAPGPLWNTLSPCYCAPLVCVFKFPGGLVVWRLLLQSNKRICAPGPNHR